MTLLWMDGFDAYGTDGQDISAALRTSLYARANGVTSSSLTRTGRGQCVWFDAASGVKDVRKAFDARGSLVVGFAWKVSSIGSLRNICEFWHDDQFGTLMRHCGIYMAGDGALVFATSNGPGTGGIVGSDGDNKFKRFETGPNLLFPDVWHYFEVKITFHDTEGNIQVKVDGQTCISFTGRTKNPQAPALCNIFRVGSWYLEDSVGARVYLDDLYICDTLGAEHNDFLGDCVVHTVFPFADAGPNEMSVFGGAIQHYMTLGDVPSDGDVSYLYSNALDATELFTIDTLPQNILDILAVSVHFRARKDSAGYGNVKPIMKLDTEMDLGKLIALTGNYVTWAQMYPHAPDGTAWSKPKVQDMEIGFKIVG